MPLSSNEDSGEDDWFSFATFTDDKSDSWSRTVLVNLSHQGFVHLQHTLTQGNQEHIYQTSSLEFPQKEWVELKIYLEFGSNGYAKVWQNRTLVSSAKIDNVENQLSQVHSDKIKILPIPWSFLENRV